jgi:hypothetical protein
MKSILIPLILLLISCTKEDVMRDDSLFKVIEVTNEGNSPAMPSQYKMDSMWVTQNSVEWIVSHEADIKYYKITFKNDSIGRVDSKGWGSNSYSFVYKKHQ